MSAVGTARMTHGLQRKGTKLSLQMRCTLEAQAEGIGIPVGSMHPRQSHFGTAHPQRVRIHVINGGARLALIDTSMGGYFSPGATGIHSGTRQMHIGSSSHRVTSYLLIKWKRSVRTSEPIYQSRLEKSKGRQAVLLRVSVGFRSQTLVTDVYFRVRRVLPRPMGRHTILPVDDVGSRKALSPTCCGAECMPLSRV